MIVRLALLLACCNAFVANAQDRLVVVLKEQAVVERVNIRLADVAEVRTTDAALRRRLEALQVGLVPRERAQRTVRRDDVLALVAHTEGVAHAVGQGAAHTTVRLRTNDYPAARLVDLARDHLARHLREKTPALTRIDIAPAGDVPDLRLPSDAVAVSPRPILGNGASKRTCVWLDVSVNGKAYRSLPVWLNVKSYAPVLVARRSLKPRERIEAADVAVEERDVAGFTRKTLLASTDAVAGQRARTFIPAGAVVHARNLELNPAVLATDLVDVRVTAGPIRIEAQGIAEQDGHIGDYVSIRNPKTAETFRAKVVGENRVAITQR